MDQNEKIANDKIAKLENEIKVLKNEVQAVLLDLRESYLNLENPFTSAASPSATQQIVITDRTPVRESRPEPQPEDTSKGKNTESRKSPEESQKPRALKLEQDAPSKSVTLISADLETTRKENAAKPVSFSIQEPRPAGPGEPASKNNHKPDLVTIAGLTGWVENSVKNLGKERAAAVLDISEAMGYISADIKPILIKLISLAPQNAVEKLIRTRDYIDSLIKLNGLLNKDSREEPALLLLSMVSEEVNHG